MIFSNCFYSHAKATHTFCLENYKRDLALLIVLSHISWYRNWWTESARFSL